jgi:hypothetical protein
VRRTRVGGDLKEGFGTVLLAKDAEEYETRDPGPDDYVRRTVTGLTSPTFTYTTAMQAEDFPEGYPASAFAVYQISAQVGPGVCRPVRVPERAAAYDARRDHRRGPGRQRHLELSRQHGHGPARRRRLRPDALGFCYLGSSVSGNIRMGLYTDNAGEPGALIAATEAKGVLRHQLGPLGGVHVYLAAHDYRGVKYWLACHTDMSVNSPAPTAATRTTLGLDPPDHAVVLSVDDKCQIPSPRLHPTRVAAQAGRPGQ